MIDKSNFTLDFRYALAIPLKNRPEIIRHYKRMEHEYNYIHKITQIRGSVHAQQLIERWLRWSNSLTITQTLDIKDIYYLIKIVTKKDVGYCKQIGGKIHPYSYQNTRTMAIAMLGPGKEIVIRIYPQYIGDEASPIKPDIYQNLKYYYKLRARATVILKPR